jgi:hypothetical protein
VLSATGSGLPTIVSAAAVFSCCVTTTMMDGGRPSPHGHNSSSRKNSTWSTRRSGGGEALTIRSLRLSRSTSTSAWQRCAASTASFAGRTPRRGDRVMSDDSDTLSCGLEDHTTLAAAHLTAFGHLAAVRGVDRSLDAAAASRWILDGRYTTARRPSAHTPLRARRATGRIPPRPGRRSPWPER